MLASMSQAMSPIIHLLGIVFDTIIDTLFGMCTYHCTISKGYKLEVM